MANFNTHLMGATITTAITTGYLINEGMENPIGFIPFAALGIAGGFLPDLDSDNSTSARYVFNFLATIFPLFFFIEFFQYFSLIKLLVVSLAMVLFIKIVMFSLFKKLTVHRGIIHSVQTGIMFSLFTVFVLQQVSFVSDDIPLNAGIVLFVGFLTHLVLDELYAVNLAGFALKRSFGTALKFINIGEFIPSLFVYSTIIILSILVIIGH